jgi:hypothetical protein
MLDAEEITFKPNNLNEIEFNLYTLGMIIT